MYSVVNLNKMLKKQFSCWRWLKTPSHSCDVIGKFFLNKVTYFQHDLGFLSPKWTCLFPQYWVGRSQWPQDKNRRNVDFGGCHGISVSWRRKYIPNNIKMIAPFYKHHDDVIKGKHFPRYWPFVRGIHRSPVNSPHKGQWHGALMFSSICVWINSWVNNREAGDLRRCHAHYDVTVMWINTIIFP